MRIIRITTVPISLRILLKGQLKYLRSNNFDPIMVSSDGKEINELKLEQGADHFVIPMTRTISPLTDFLCILKFFFLCRKLKPAIVHSHTPKAGLVGMIGARLAGVKIRMHTVAGLPLMEATGYKRNLLMLIERLIYNCSTQVYSNSFKLREFIINHKLCNPDKIKVIGNGSSNGIDVDYFSPTETLKEASEAIKNRYHIGAENFTFIYIGRLVKDKGIVELVSAFIDMVKTYENARLMLVGDYEPNLDKLPDEILNIINSHDKIHFVGFQNDIRPYLLSADVLVLPSYREGFPNVPMQGGLMNLPAIVSDINGCNEIIINGENGLTVPAKDSISLKNSMVDLMKNPDKYSYLAANARSMIVDRFEQNKLWDLLVSEYKSELNKVNSV